MQTRKPVPSMLPAATMATKLLAPPPIDPKREAFTQALFMDSSIPVPIVLRVLDHYDRHVDETTFAWNRPG